MPFSKTSKKHTEEYWTKHFELFLKPLIEENSGLEARRSEALRGDIVKQIITQLVVSPVVVADLTDGNSNVHWELGVRQGFKHGTITIAEKGTKLPFDLSAKGTLFYYPGKYIKTAQFTRIFKKAIKDCLAHPEYPDSHVLETISGRGTLFQIIRRDETLRRVEALISETNYNLTVMEAVYETIKANKQARKKNEPKNYPTARVRSASIELLIATRYLEAEESFFKSAESYLDWANSVNGQLSMWEQSEEMTENWFVNQKKNILGPFQLLKTKLEAILKKLTASC